MITAEANKTTLQHSPTYEMMRPMLMGQHGDFLCSLLYVREEKRNLSEFLSIAKNIPNKDSGQGERHLGNPQGKREAVTGFLKSLSTRKDPERQEF